MLNFNCETFCFVDPRGSVCFSGKFSYDILTCSAGISWNSSWLFTGEKGLCLWTFGWGYILGFRVLSSILI